MIKNRKIYQELDTSLGYHKWGCVRVHSESKEHFMAKCECAWEIHMKGHVVGTEVKLKGLKEIIDVMDLTTGEKYEIVKTSKPDRKEEVTWRMV